MKRTILLLLLLLSITVPIQGINYMDLLCEIEENRDYDRLGSGMAALDFNGDGYDDLAVLELGWVPDSLMSQLPSARFGRILFYYGGPNFDNVPDFTIEGQYQWHLVTAVSSSYLARLGDINGDGYDDLGVRGNTDSTDGPSRIPDPMWQSISEGKAPPINRDIIRPFPVYIKDLLKLTQWGISIMMGMMISVLLIWQIVIMMS